MCWRWKFLTHLMKLQEPEWPMMMPAYTVDGKSVGIQWPLDMDVRCEENNVSGTLSTESPRRGYTSTSPWVDTVIYNGRTQYNEISALLQRNKKPVRLQWNTLEMIFTHVSNPLPYRSLKHIVVLWRQQNGGRRLDLDWGIFNRT